MTDRLLLPLVELNITTCLCGREIRKPASQCNACLVRPVLG